MSSSCSEKGQAAYVLYTDAIARLKQLHIGEIARADFLVSQTAAKYICR